MQISTFDEGSLTLWRAGRAVSSRAANAACRELQESTLAEVTIMQLGDGQ